MNKCVFCERQFENPEYGTIEFDVEHFRPKSSVEPWPDATRHPTLTYAFETGAVLASGYFWLAYDLQNYAASCKVCNTIFKLNFFPIAGTRGVTPASATTLMIEKSFLCYPIGDIDADPESLVTFSATTAVPAASDGHDHWRGRIIIDFFGLNDREQLHRERARMIALFGGAMRAVKNGTATDDDRELIGQMHSPALPHAACVRAFKRLWATDPVTADLVYVECRKFAVSSGGVAPPSP
jgi:hypothetical protein